MIPPEEVGEGNRVISIELERDTAVEVGSESDEQLNKPKKSFNRVESRLSPAVFTGDQPQRRSAMFQMQIWV